VRNVFLISFFFFFLNFLSISKVLAASYTVFPQSGGSYVASAKPSSGNWAAKDNDTSEWSCSGFNYDTTDLSACVAFGKSPSNTCCSTSSGCTAADGTSLSQWDYNYASSCHVSASGGGFFCNFTVVYQTQTCPATDSCVNPYINPGLCTTNGCAVSSTPYKACCSGSSLRACVGGQYSGGCPSGSSSVFCGFGSYPPCSNACPTPTPTAAPTSTPTATPTPTPTGTCTPSGKLFCSGSQICICNANGTSTCGSCDPGRTCVESGGSASCPTQVCTPGSTQSVCTGTACTL